MLRGADVALIPYAINDLTRSVFPMKVFEYLAAGLPVVTTPLPALAGNRAGGGGRRRPGHGRRRGARAGQDGPEARRARSAAVRDNSWDARLDEIAPIFPALRRA